VTLGPGKSGTMEAGVGLATPKAKVPDRACSGVHRTVCRPVNRYYARITLAEPALGDLAGIQGWHAEGPRCSLTWDPGLTPGSPVRMGQRIGSLASSAQTSQ
jgi:hypothetical protein